MTTPATLAPAAPTGARAELLVLAAVTLAGAVAGVLVQAGVELARDRHNTREQLQLAGEQLDTYDAAVTAWRHEAIENSRKVGQLREQLDDVWKERDQALEQLAALRELHELDPDASDAPAPEAPAGAAAPGSRSAPSGCS